MSQTNVTNEQINQFKNSISKAGYFKFVKDSEEINTWDEMQTESLQQYGWLRFPDHSAIIEKKTGTYPQDNENLFDYRTIMVDGDYMFRGGMEHYLKMATQIFEVRGLKFEVRDEKMDWGENDQKNNYHYFKHVVYVNDKEIIIADGNLNQMGGHMYFLKYKEMIENELKTQGSKEEVRLVNYQDGVVMLIGDSNLLDKYETGIEPFENRMIK